MNTLAVLLASLLLLIPGFLGLSIFRYLQGVRIAEAQSTLLWSLLLSALNLGLILLIGLARAWPPVERFVALSLTQATNDTTVSDILALSLWTAALALCGGLILGSLLRLPALRAWLASFSGQAFNPDPWANLLGGDIDEPLVIVRMEDGRQFLGNALQVNETPNGRTIALKDAVMFAADDPGMRTAIVPLRPGTTIITAKIEAVTLLDETSNDQIQAMTAPEQEDLGEEISLPLDVPPS